MRQLPADRVAETLGVAAAAARKLVAAQPDGSYTATFAQLSRALRVLEEDRSPESARLCANQFRALRGSWSLLDPDLAGPLESALTALTALAALPSAPPPSLPVKRRTR